MIFLKKIISNTGIGFSYNIQGNLSVRIDTGYDLKVNGYNINIGYGHTY